MILSLTPFSLTQFRSLRQRNQSWFRGPLFDPQPKPPFILFYFTLDSLIPPQDLPSLGGMVDTLFAICFASFSYNGFVFLRLLLSIFLFSFDCWSNILHFVFSCFSTSIWSESRSRVGGIAYLFVVIVLLDYKNIYI